MLINMNSPILGIDGIPVTQGEPPEPVLLRSVVQGALLASVPEDRAMDGQTKARMFKLAMDANAETVEWTVEDVATVKQRVGMVAVPLAVGRAYELLDPPA
jgi:hypothetical protein